MHPQLVQLGLRDAFLKVFRCERQTTAVDSVIRRSNRLVPLSRRFEGLFVVETGRLSHKQPLQYNFLGARPARQPLEGRGPLKAQKYTGKRKE